MNLLIIGIVLLLINILIIGDYWHSTVVDDEYIDFWHSIVIDEYIDLL